MNTHSCITQKYTQSNWVASVSRAKSLEYMNRDSFRVALLVIRVFCFAIMYVFRALRSICKMNIKAYINFFVVVSFIWICSRNECVNTRAHFSSIQRSKRKKDEKIKKNRPKLFFDRDSRVYLHKNSHVTFIWISLTNVESVHSLFRYYTKKENLIKILLHILPFKLYTKWLCDLERTWFQA